MGIPIISTESARARKDRRSLGHYLVVGDRRAVLHALAALCLEIQPDYVEATAICRSVNRTRTPHTALALRSVHRPVHAHADASRRACRGLSACSLGRELRHFNLA